MRSEFRLETTHQRAASDFNKLLSVVPCLVLDLVPVWSRTGPFEVSADLEESMEFVEPEAVGPAEESGDEAVTDEETDLGTDWETVPSPRFCDIPSQVKHLNQTRNA